MGGYPDDWQKRKRKVLCRDNYKCQECGNHESYIPLEVHHIWPLGSGGDNSYDNLETLCIKCHYRKKHSNGDDLYGVPPTHALINLLKKLDPEKYDTRSKIKSEMGERLGYENGYSFKLTRGVKNIVNRNIDSYLDDREWEPQYEYSDPDVSFKTVENYYYANGCSLSIEELMNEFDICRKDAELVIK